MVRRIDISIMNLIQSIFDFFFGMYDKNETNKPGSLYCWDLVYEARLWRGSEEFGHRVTIQKPCRIDRVFDRNSQELFVFDSSIFCFFIDHFLDLIVFCLQYLPVE